MIALTAGARLWAGLRRNYASADPRSLALFRVVFGALLVRDVLSRWPEVEAHYSNTGWLTNHFALFRPMSDHLFSVYFAFGSPREVKLMLLLHLGVSMLLLVGFNTRLMQILSFVLITSLNSRNIMLENGGSVVLNLVSLWTVFMPLGRRFSVDALRRSFVVRREASIAALSEHDDPPRDARPFVSLSVTALLLQWSVIYFFNTVHKTGEPWRDGSAVHYFLQQERLVTSLGAWLAQTAPLGVMKALTYGTLLIEASIPLLLLAPFRPELLRMLALLLAGVLHLSIHATLDLGSFSWAMLVPYLVFVPAGAWERVSAWFRARRTARTLHVNVESGAALMLARWVKRLDLLGLVSYRAISDSSPRRAQRTLAVSQGESVRGGFDAVLALSDALWFGRAPLLLLGKLGLRKRIEARLKRMARDPEALDEEWGVSELPRLGDARAPEPSPARRAWWNLRAGVRELVIGLSMIVLGSQVLLENAAVPRWLKPRRPGWFAAAIEYPRLFQGWSMFAPVPPQGDGRLVIDGRTKSGQNLDPLTGHAPVFEVAAPGAERQNLLWAYFHARIPEQRFRVYWNGVRDFVLKHHQLSERPDHEIVAFDAYYVRQAFAPPGAERKPAEREKLFSHGSVGSPRSGKR
jgi:hypothetical protein